jgi:hypothetical protein
MQAPYRLSWDHLSQKLGSLWEAWEGHATRGIAETSVDKEKTNKKNKVCPNNAVIGWDIGWGIGWGTGWAPTINT